MLFATVTRDPGTAPFFDAAADGVLMLRRCAACDHWEGPSSDRCLSCQSDEEPVWTVASGRGTVITWGVVHPRPAKDDTSPEPTVIGIVETAEGPWLTLQLRDVDPATLQIGDAVEVDFDRSGEEAVPFFRPAS